MIFRVPMIKKVNKKLQINKKNYKYKSNKIYQGIQF